MGKIAINGRFTVRRLGGQERYSYEVIRYLDKIAKPNEFELIVPHYVEKERIPSVVNIEVKEIGKIKGHFWEQTDYLSYLLKNRKIGYNPCITCPILKPDITTLHDIGQLINYQNYKNIYGKLSRQWHKMMFLSSAKSSRLIFTVSEFSKKEIVKYLNVNPSRIVVTGSGWQHFEEIHEDITIFKRRAEIIPGEYYLSASSLTPQKNYKWVVDAAKFNPKEKFIIVGAKVKLTQEDYSKHPNNLLYLGVVTDGEMKALMHYCKAFIHPATYEGFGLTPMEAMSVGARIILADSSCLPEIYEDTVHYIDPYNANVNLNDILKLPVSNYTKVLQKYSWEKTAKIIYESIKNYYEL